MIDSRSCLNALAFPYTEKRVKTREDKDEGKSFPSLFLLSAKTKNKNETKLYNLFQKQPIHLQTSSLVTLK
jgi:hypothetical protein